MQTALVLLTAAAAQVAIAADPVQVKVNAIGAEGTGQPLGTILFSNSRFGGVLIRPDLGGLSPGLHGFHLHENPDCGTAIKEGKVVAGAAAGGHFDPRQSRTHEGPYGRGHLGDLPALHADAGGRVTLPLLAPRLTLADLRGHAVVIHAGGDNYADQPQSLGGGGARVACGVIPAKP
jgi:Cu-Zn family superoxide dismutase